MKLYHVTLRSNLESILSNGLIPDIGERSYDAGETQKFVFLFPTKNDVENAMLTWLGEYYCDEDIVYLEVNLPDNFPIEQGEVEYEMISRQIIPKEYINIIEL